MLLDLVIGGIAIAVGLIWSQPVWAGKGKTLAGKKPNIIVVITDDQGYGDLGCHGNPVIKTPHIDKLHKKSMRFTAMAISAVTATR
jgi:hypothetical protein